jgi:hypothetical protein
MKVSWKHVTRRMSAAFCSILLIVLLAACGGSGSGSSSVTPTPKPPTPTPTPAVAMQQYTGTKFSISYPQGWQQSTSASGVGFTDPVSKNMLVIATVANAGGLQSPSALAGTTMPIMEKIFLKNAKPATIAPTATIGGETWVQSSATGELITDPGAQGTFVGLFTNHPANAADTQAYEIYYFGPSATFTQATTLAFQPMLQSFKFTA